METLTGVDKNGNAAEFENMGVISDNEWKEFKNGEKMYKKKEFFAYEENIRFRLERIFYLTGKGMCVYINGIPKFLKEDSVSKDTKKEISYVREDCFSVESYLLDDIFSLMGEIEELEKENGNGKVNVVAVFDNKLAFKWKNSYTGVTSVFRGRLGSEVTDDEENVYSYTKYHEKETYTLNEDGTTTLFAVDNWDDYHEEHENSIEGTPLAIMRDAILAHERRNEQMKAATKKLYGAHENGETVEVEVIGVVDSATWNAYKCGGCDSYTTSTSAEKLKEQYMTYAERERKQRAELEKVNVNLHTAIVEVKERLGGKGDVVIHIGKDAVTVAVDEQYVDTDVTGKKYRTISAEEKRGINRMKVIIGYYRRKTRIEKSLSRTMYYKTKKAAEYEEKTGEMLENIIVMDGELENLKEEMRSSRSKYQNFEKNKNKIAVHYKNYKVDKDSIHVGYLKQRGYDYLVFNDYKEYADYEKLWYEDKGLTNWRMRDYKCVKPKAPKIDIPKADEVQQIQQVDVQAPLKRKRGRPLGSKNKPKNIAVTA